MTPPRENGLVHLPGTNVVEAAISEGWVKVRESGKKDKSEEEEALFAKLKVLEDQAKSTAAGLWTSESNGKFEVLTDISGKEKALYEQWKGKDIDGTTFV
jgi:hypothetical protein